MSNIFVIHAREGTCTNIGNKTTVGTSEQQLYTCMGSICESCNIAVGWAASSVPRGILWRYGGCVVAVRLVAVYLCIRPHVSWKKDNPQLVYGKEPPMRVSQRGQICSYCGRPACALPTISYLNPPCMTSEITGSPCTALHAVAVPF